MIRSSLQDEKQGAGPPIASVTEIPVNSTAVTTSIAVTSVPLLQTVMTSMTHQQQQQQPSSGVIDKSTITTISAVVAAISTNCISTHTTSQPAVTTVTSSALTSSGAFSPTFSSTENEDGSAVGVGAGVSVLATSAAVSTCEQQYSAGSSASSTCLHRLIGTANATGPSLATGTMTAKRAPQHVLNRSDSTGSTTGRKFLTPTCTDIGTITTQQHHRTADKERQLHPKKRNSITTSIAPAAIATTAVPMPLGNGASTSAVVRYDGGISKSSSFFAQFNHEISQYHYPAPMHTHGQQHSLHYGDGTSGATALLNMVAAGGNNKLLSLYSQANVVYEVHDWWQEQVICTQSSDDES